MIAFFWPVAVSTGCLCSACNSSSWARLLPCIPTLHLALSAWGHSCNAACLPCCLLPAATSMLLHWQWPARLLQASSTTNTGETWQRWQQQLWQSQQQLQQRTTFDKMAPLKDDSVVCHVLQSTMCCKAMHLHASAVRRLLAAAESHCTSRLYTLAALSLRVVRVKCGQHTLFFVCCAILSCTVQCHYVCVCVVQQLKELGCIWRARVFPKS